MIRRNNTCKYDGFEVDVEQGVKVGYGLLIWAWHGEAGLGVHGLGFPRIWPDDFGVQKSWSSRSRSSESRVQQPLAQSPYAHAAKRLPILETLDP